MWQMLVPMGIGLGTGLLSNAEKKKQYKKDMQVQATMEETSPWTGKHGEYQSAPGVMGDAMGGLATGASMGMNMQNMSSQQDLQQQLLDIERQKAAAMGGGYGVNTIPKVGGFGSGTVKG